MTEYKKQQNLSRHKFLLEQFFKDIPDVHSVKEVDDWVLVKYFDASTATWRVAIYTKESYENSQSYLKNGVDRG